MIFLTVLRYLRYLPTLCEGGNQTLHALDCITATEQIEWQRGGD